MLGRRPRLVLVDCPVFVASAARAVVHCLAAVPHSTRSPARCCSACESEHGQRWDASVILAAVFEAVAR